MNVVFIPEPFWPATWRAKEIKTDEVFGRDCAGQGRHRFPINHVVDPFKSVPTSLVLNNLVRKTPLACSALHYCPPWHK